MQDSWLPTLITETPEQGFEALLLSRKAVGKIQPDENIRKML